MFQLISILIIFYLCGFFWGCAKTEEKAFKKAESLNTSKSYKAFLEKWPAGKYREIVVKRVDSIETSFYIQAIAQKNIDAFLNYLKVWPDGKLVDSIKLFYDEPFFKKSQDNPKLLENYLSIFKNGKFRKSAELRIEILLWNKCKEKRNEDDCQRYLSRIPKGKYREQALRNICEKGGSAAAYIKYIKEFPGTPFSERYLINLYDSLSAEYQEKEYYTEVSRFYFLNQVRNNIVNDEPYIISFAPKYATKQAADKVSFRNHISTVFINLSGKPATISRVDQQIMSPKGRALVQSEISKPAGPRTIKPLHIRPFQKGHHRYGAPINTSGVKIRLDYLYGREDKLRVSSYSYIK